MHVTCKARVIAPSEPVGLLQKSVVTICASGCNQRVSAPVGPIGISPDCWTMCVSAMWHTLCPQCVVCVQFVDCAKPVICDLRRWAIVVGLAGESGQIVHKGNTINSIQHKVLLSNNGMELDAQKAFSSVAGCIAFHILTVIELELFPGRLQPSPPQCSAQCASL